jgi:hypothetical protein
LVCPKDESRRENGEVYKGSCNSLNVNGYSGVTFAVPELCITRCRLRPIARPLFTGPIDKAAEVVGRQRIIVDLHLHSFGDALRDVNVFEYLIDDLGMQEER